MRSIILAFSAAVLYGLTSVILEQKLFKFHALTIIVGQFSVLLILAIVFRQVFKLNSPSEIDFGFPTDKAFIWMISVGFIIFFANYFFTQAFTCGGNAVVITSLLILIPVASAIFRTFWVREMPNLYQVLGFVFAAIAVILVAKGNVSK